MSGVQLAESLTLPPAIVTESVGIFGRKGSGKTYTGGKLFEEMHGIGAQCVVLDPVGNWWGLRLSASGKRAGLDIPVFGGDRGDIPITPQGGRLMAQTVVERNISCVIDLMGFRPAQRKEFATDFAEELFELKKRRRTPLHLFLEEARLFIPQQQRSKLDTRMIDAFEQIVRLGRNYGLGVSLLDQRPQSVNKEVTGQTEVLIVHQLVEHQGRKAIEEWVRSKKTQGAEQLEQLDELRSGEAFIWSPGLLRTFARIRVAKKTTYDASGTPELGGVDVAAPKPLSSKDLTQLQESMASVVEQAEANDPAKLRRLIAELRRELAVKQAVAPGKTVERIVEVPVTDPKLLKGLLALERDVGRALASTQADIAKATAILSRFAADASMAKPAAAPASRPQVAPVAARATPAPARATTPVVADGTLSKAEVTLLRALAWWESIGVGQPSVKAVAFLAGYDPTGGYFGNTKGGMRTKGLIEYSSSGHMCLTELGRGKAPVMNRPLTREDVHNAVLAELSAAEKKIVTALLESYPDAMTTAQVGEATGFDPTGGYFGNTRGRLKTMGLIDYPTKGMLRASDVLFTI